MEDRVTYLEKTSEYICDQLTEIEAEHQEFLHDINHRFSIVEENIDRLHEKIDKNLADAHYKNLELTDAYMSLVRQVGLIGKELEEVDKLLS